MMRWRRNKGNTGNGMTRLCNDFVHFITRQLSAFSGFSPLCHFYLYFIGIHQIFCRNTETSGSDLFYCRTHGKSVFQRNETNGIFSSFSSITTSANFIHCQSYCLMSFFTDRPETHCSCNKTLHNMRNGFYIFDRNRILFKR